MTTASLPLSDLAATGWQRLMRSRELPLPSLELVPEALGALNEAAAWRAAMHLAGNPIAEHIPLEEEPCEKALREELTRALPRLQMQQHRKSN